MAISFLLEVFTSHRDDDAIVWKNKAYRYGWLLEKIAEARAGLRG
jgi:hypothetical protein